MPYTMRKAKGGYNVKSKASGRTYHVKSKAAGKRLMQQHEMFKHMRAAGVKLRKQR